MFVPAEGAGLETRLRGFVQSPDDLRIEVVRAVTDQTAGTSACLCRLFAQLFITVVTEAEGEHSDSLALRSHLLDHLIIVANLTISEDKHALKELSPVFS